MLPHVIDRWNIFNFTEHTFYLNFVFLFKNQSSLLFIKIQIENNNEKDEAWLDVMEGKRESWENIKRSVGDKGFEKAYLFYHR